MRTDRVGEVLPLLREAEASGLFAAGFISYEASSAFDSALKTREAEGFPLVCLGLFHAPAVLDGIEAVAGASYRVGALSPSVSRAEFVAAIGKIKERIAEGATYQVNYTYRLMGSFEGNAWAFFYELVRAQKTDYAAFVEVDEWAICSASPELFFNYSKGTIMARPMKGTARRGRTLAEDWQQAEALRDSEKDRAENIMIVDMIRNDIGRVAQLGSVEVVKQFEVEKYPTCWQMTSTVCGHLRGAGFQPANGQAERPAPQTVRMLKALFPCASITGAPKAKTMEIIRNIETTSRKIYTGSIGFITPQGESCFNVAIRTALIDQKAGLLEYGVGGGIVWDSDAADEYEETLTKARVLTQPRPDFRLLETMLWEPETSIFLLDGHMQRLGKSAAYLDVPLEMHEVQAELDRVVAELKPVAHRIRILVGRDGEIEVQTFELEMVAEDAAPLRVALAETPIDSSDIFLFHKTTHRTVYEQAKAAFPAADDVILFNERGEITESCVANVVIRKGDRLVTPPVSCGLLAGTFRDDLLKRGEVFEAVITVADLKLAQEIYLVNSVRKWRRASFSRSLWVKL